MHVLVNSTGITWNKLIRHDDMWICQRNAYFKFILSTHIRTHILIPFEDHKLTGLKAVKVDIAS